MTHNLSESTRAVVAETLPIMELKRSRLEKALERYMARQGPSRPSAGGAAGPIADMLFRNVGRLADNGSGGVDETAQRHRALGLGGEHYSLFGDALKPVMRDVLGSEATSTVIAAWGDAYWAIVRMLYGQEKRLAA
jgi:hemoglobin-like flavoprotein